MRSKGTAVVVIASLIVALCLMGGANMAWGATDAPSGQLSIVEPLPNFFFDHYHEAASIDQRDTVNTTLVIDPPNGLVLEINSYHNCDFGPNFVSYDSDTFILKKQACLPDPSDDARLKSAVRGQTGNSKSAFVAVDSARRLLYFPVNPSGNGTSPFSNLPGQVAVVSEETLGLVDVWDLPSDALPDISGISYFAPSDQLILITGRGNKAVSGPDVAPGVAVAAIDVGKSLKQHATFELWAQAIDQCQYGLSVKYGTAAAYRSQNQDAVFVPCTYAFAANETFYERDGLVKVELGPPTQSVGCYVGADLCPTGKRSMVLSPEVIKDFYFDAVSDRGFMPTSGSSGVSIDMYDGMRGEFVGRSNVGSASDINGMSFGLDGATGRVYAGGPGGTTFVEGRRTPLAPGRKCVECSGYANYMSFVVLPPSQLHPYPRVVMNFEQGDQSSFCGTCQLERFTVLADRIPLSQDPPFAEIDANTFGGKIPAGALVSSNFGAHARGYGVHSVLVGGASGLVNNVLGVGVGDSIPFGPGHRDLFAGYVGKLDLDSASSQAEAAAVSDANGQTAGDLNALMSGRLSPNQPFTSPVTVGQQWPSVPALCDQPGPTDKSRSEQQGLFVGGQPVPGSQALADASVDCASDLQKASGKALAGLLDFDLGELGIGVGEARVAAAALAPSVSSGAASQVTASVRDLRVSVGGKDLLLIGEIMQRADSIAGGVAGSARATRAVTLSHVVLQGDTVCDFECSDSEAVIDAINERFPGFIHVMAPQPDPLLLSGSPGGYTAGVQAPIAEQYGDRQFNAMGAAEAALLPALRVVIYNDGKYGLSRQVLDLAGVQIDSELGLSFLEAPTNSPPFVDIDQAASASGLVPSYLSDATATNHGSVFHRLRQLIHRIFAGLKFMLRSPAEAARSLATIALLASGPMFMARRSSLVRSLRLR